MNGMRIEANPLLAFIAASEHASGLLDVATGRRRQTKRQAKQCALPGCEAVTTHNGGYCCADHCREHRRASVQPTRK
jgi:hypothetical protein